MRRSYTPRLTATYRVQLHAGFTLRDAAAVVPYLAELGISHLYASPIFAARPGSRHGYDVVDPRRINPELGDEAALAGLAGALHERGMGLIVDIVPNHMGLGEHNPYWQDVLANGEQSRYAGWFDIAWDMHADRRLVVPSLADENAPPEEHRHHRVVHWRRGAREINYRRFFDVNDLVALRMEDPAVFDETHEYLLSLVERGLVDGLRVDHVDGLRDPLAYLERLRAETGRRRVGGVPIFVEKILTGDERLRTSWPVDGTTGYERLNDVEDLFIDPEGFARLEGRYRSRRRSKDLTFSGTVRADKREVLDRAFAADVERLARLLSRILAGAGEQTSPAQVFHGIEEYIAATPVYRTYVQPGAPPSADDVAVIDAMQLVDADTVANRISSIMRGEVSSGGAAGLHHELVARMQQITGPAMAKGLEDTAHYAYVPLASRNEVGGSPDRPLANAVGRLHEVNAWYGEHFPSSLVATSTHDTKRSGDVRARISALSEIDRDWERVVGRWRRLNRPHQRIVRGRIVPDPNAEVLVYQTLVGIWPGPREGRRSDDIPDRVWRDGAAERLREYMLKAVREAKLRTSWTDPDAEYEAAMMDFIGAIMRGHEDDPFLTDLSRLVARVAPIARSNTLSRILLHLTIPGTPDVYQGDEAWNFALVDPDNRRPVDYRALGARIDEKAAFTRRLLAVRREHATLFGEGTYLPLVTRGPAARHVVAFERRLHDRRAIVVAPRLVGRAPVDWRGTSVQVGEGPAELVCAITGRARVIADGRLEIDDTPLSLYLG